MRTLPSILLVVAMWSSAAAAQPSIPLVHSRSPAWATPNAGWRVEPEPLIKLGLQEGPPHLLFDRIVGVYISEGFVVVGDGGAKEVRILTRTGDLVRKFGREGDGPGEMRDLTRLWLDPAGRPAAYDGALKRLTIYRENDRPLTIPVQGASAFVTPLGRMANGMFVTATPLRSRLGGEHGDILIDSMTFWVGADAHRTIARFPNRSRMVFATPEWMRYPFVPLAVGPVAAVVESGFVLGHGDTAELLFYDSTGAQIRTVRWDAARERVTDRMKEELGALLVEDQREADRPAWRRFVREVPYPEYIPLFDAVHIDPAGATWVRSYSYRRNQPERWTVFSAEGRWLGYVTLPESFRATHFTENEVAGVARDHLGVERAVVYRLIRH